MASEEVIRECARKILREESLIIFRDCLSSWEEIFIDYFNGKTRYFDKQNALKCAILCSELRKYLDEIENKQ